MGLSPRPQPIAEGVPGWCLGIFRWGGGFHPPRPLVLRFERRQTAKEIFWSKLIGTKGAKDF